MSVRSRKFSQAAIYASSAGGGVPFGISFVGTANNVVAASSFTFTAQGIGTADTTRIVVVAIAHGVTGGISVSSVTIAGNLATQATGAAGDSTGGSFTDIWYLAVPTGTTANIVVNLSASQSRCAIDVYSVVGTGAAFSAANKAASINSSTEAPVVTVPAGGGVIAVLNVHSSAVAGTVTNGGNLTIDQNGVAFGNSVIAAGSNTTASGSTTFTMNWTGATDNSMSVASFVP